MTPEAPDGSQCYADERMESPAANIDRSAWRLLPSEKVLWHGRPTLGIARARRWVFVPAIFFVFAAVALLFAGLLWVSEIPGHANTALIACYLSIGGLGFLLAPRYLLDPCEFLATDRRVIWKRGRMTRNIETSGITYARIRWHRAVAGVGDLELVRAVPFGPLARRQRLFLHDVKAPDAVFALIRGVEPAAKAGDPDVPITDRLDDDERVLWGGGPEGYLLGWRDVATAVAGLGVLAIGMRYGIGVGEILLGLEQIGLPVESWTWAFFFGATVIAFAMIMAVGATLLWHGLLRSRALGRATEYVLTNRRLLIRRGNTELSVDRRRIVDVAETPSSRGSHNLFLILDAPQARALAMSGALGMWTPARDVVPPVLYEVRDVENVRELILDGVSRGSLPPLRDAA